MAGVLVREEKMDVFCCRVIEQNNKKDTEDLSILLSTAARRVCFVRRLDVCCGGRVGRVENNRRWVVMTRRWGVCSTDKRMMDIA